jgi:hypothetical protein
MHQKQPPANVATAVGCGVGLSAARRAEGDSKLIPTIVANSNGFLERSFLLRVIATRNLLLLLQPPHRRASSQNPIACSSSGFPSLCNRGINGPGDAAKPAPPNRPLSPQG